MIAMDYLSNIQRMLGGETFSRVNEEYYEQLLTFPGSIRHHHSESGGYIRHICEVMDFCKMMTNNFQIPRFSDHELLLKLAFIHDLDKLERYELDPEMPTKKQITYAESLGIVIDEKDCKSSLSTKIDNKKNKLNKPIQYFRYKDKLPADDSARVVRICMELGIPLTDDDVHAISCHHGGWANVLQKGGILSPTATILHCADLMSTQILGDLREDW